MSKKEVIAQQKKLLETYRRTLTIRLDQFAKTGSLNARPETIHDILEARENIRRIKVTLRDLGVSVADEPADAAPQISNSEISGKRLPKKIEIINDTTSWNTTVINVSFTLTSRHTITRKLKFGPVRLSYTLSIDNIVVKQSEDYTLGSIKFEHKSIIDDSECMIEFWWKIGFYGDSIYIDGQKLL